MNKLKDTFLKQLALTNKQFSDYENPSMMDNVARQLIGIMLDNTISSDQQLYAFKEMVEVINTAERFCK